MMNNYSITSGDLVEVLGNGTEKDQFDAKWMKEIRTRLKATGWRIPTRADWMNLIAMYEVGCDWPESYSCGSLRQLGYLLDLNSDCNYWAVDGRNSYMTGSSDDGSLVFLSDYHCEENRIRLIKGEEVDKKMRKKADLITR